MGTEAPQYLGVPFSISVMAEAGEFKFGIALGFAKCNYKITPNDKSRHVLVLGDSKNLGFPFNICAMAISTLVHSLGLPIRPIRISHE